MSLVGEADATPSRVAATFRAVLRVHGRRVKREALVELLAPTSLAGAVRDLKRDPGEAADGSETGDSGSKRERVQKVIRECIDARLLVEDGDFVAPSPDLSPAEADPARTDEVLADLVCRSAFCAENERNHDLARTIAWLLAQDPRDPPGTPKEIALRLRDRDAAGLQDTTNDVRVTQALHWCVRLGFGWRDRGPVVPDPTAYIRRALPRILGPHGSSAVELRTFLERLAGEAPVFEGGRFRTLVESAFEFRDDAHLSRTTSMALLRLEEEHEIGFETLSDGRVLVLDDGEGLRRCTHIRRGERRAQRSEA